MKLSTDYLSKIITNEGESLNALSHSKPVLLIFLRHFGCTFCREAMAEISQKKSAIKEQGVQIVFVHMTDEATAVKYFKRYKLSDIAFISDPNLELYQSFGLKRGTFNQLFGLKVWMRGLKAGLVDGHGLGWLLGDGFQMPGIFLIQKNEIRAQFIHKSAADRPDYDQLINCCAIPK